MRQAPRCAALSLLGSALLLASCSLAPPAPPHADAVQINQLALGAAFDQAAANSVSEWPGELWWQQLQDQGLNQLINQALAGTPSLALARARLDQALAASGAARSADGLSGAIGASATRERFTAEELIPPPIAGATFWDNSINASARYELDLWGQRRLSLAAAVDEVHARRAELDEARRVLIGALSHSWVQLSLQYQQAGLLEDILAHQNSLLDLSRRRLHAGLGTQLDVSEAAVAPPATQAQLDAVQGHIALLRNQLAALAGLGPGAGEQLPRPTLKLDQTPTGPATIPARWLGRRPDVIADRWRIEAAARGIDIARTRYYPDIDLSAFAGVQSLGFGHLLSGAAEGYGATPAISLPIFNRGRLQAGVESQTASYDAAVASYDDSIIKAAQDVADQVAGLHELASEAADRQAALAQARQTCELAEAGLRAGLTDHSHVLEAQIALLQQHQQLLAVQARQLDAHISLAMAVGGGLTGEAKSGLAEGSQP